MKILTIILYNCFASNLIKTLQLVNKINFFTDFTKLFFILKNDQHEVIFTCWNINLCMRYAHSCSCSPHNHSPIGHDNCPVQSHFFLIWGQIKLNEKNSHVLYYEIYMLLRKKNCKKEQSGISLWGICLKLHVLSLRILNTYPRTLNNETISNFYWNISNTPGLLTSICTSN